MSAANSHGALWTRLYGKKKVLARQPHPLIVTLYCNPSSPSNIRFDATSCLEHDERRVEYEPLYEKSVRRPFIGTWLLLSLIMTAVKSGNWKPSTGRSDDDTVVSAEAKSQPSQRNRKNVVAAAAASCQGGASVTHACQGRRRVRTLAPLCVPALTRLTGYFTRRTRTTTVIHKTRPLTR